VACHRGIAQLHGHFFGRGSGRARRGGRASSSDSRTGGEHQETGDRGFVAHGGLSIWR
jgi:hypothetical protein